MQFWGGWDDGELTKSTAGGTADQPRRNHTDEHVRLTGREYQCAGHQSAVI
jgi:hypothetical protein